MKIGEEEWRIIGVYVNKDLGKKIKILKEWWDRGTEERVLIEGDFNARTGQEGGKVERKEEEWEGRKSKNKMISKEGRKLLEELGGTEWEILNGGVKRDEEGEYTYVGQRGE